MMSIVMVLKIVITKVTMTRTMVKKYLILF